MTDQTGLRQFQTLQVDLQQRLPRYVFRALAAGLYDQGRHFLEQEYRPHIRSAFKTGGRRVANSFKVYTSGNNTGELTLGIFTRWDAAPIYEAGGTITSKRGRWLMFPVTPRAYTAGGRVRRDWRDPNDPTKWNAARLEGLFQLPTRKPGVYILARDTTATVTKTGRVAVRAAGQRGGNTIEPVFVLIRSTRREAVLEFFERFERFAGRDGQRLGRAVGRALQAFARPGENDVVGA